MLPPKFERVTVLGSLLMNMIVHHEADEGLEALKRGLLISSLSFVIFVSFVVIIYRQLCTGRACDHRSWNAKDSAKLFPPLLLFVR